MNHKPLTMEDLAGHTLEEAKQEAVAWAMRYEEACAQLEVETDHRKMAVESTRRAEAAITKAALSPNVSSELIERLAAIEHERWSGWMRYLFTKGEDAINGEFLIDAASVKHWRRQMETPYEALTEREKESDRKEVRKTLAALIKRGGP